MKIVVLKDTVLKPSPEDSSTMAPEDVAPVKAGTEFPVLGYLEEVALDGTPHLKFTIDPKAYNLGDLHPSGHNTWYGFKPHLSDPEGASPDNKPRDNMGRSAKGFDIVLPGSYGTVNSQSTIIPGGHFFWYEALHATPDGRYRRPANAQVVAGILKLAEELEAIRAIFKVPISINSWYRDPATNAAVGGARQSRHLLGDAADFVVSGIHPRTVNARLDACWGSKGGLASASCFTHLDCRGYKARWDYGF